MHPDQSTLQTLARKAGQIIRTNLRIDADRTWKADESPVTVTDTHINAMVLKALRKKFPHISIIGEEGSDALEDAEYSVLCDPVDGTIPFTLGIPVSTFCILVLRNGIPIEAVIYDPFLKRMWHATRGQGAFLNGKPIRVSEHTDLRRAHLSVMWWEGAQYNLHTACQKILAAGAQCINLLSVAYGGGLIATGGLTGSIFPGQNAWETAAMQLLVEEAGGRATDIHGNPLKYTPGTAVPGHIISNGRIHDEVVRIVESCR